MPIVFQKVINVNLSRGLVGEERLPWNWYRDYIGGHGLALRYLIEDLTMKKPILQDPIIVMTGPLTGTFVPGTSKAVILSYRGKANTLKTCSIEGKFPAYLKLAGFDGLIITGFSNTPVRVYISSKESKIIGASGWWGKDVFEMKDGAQNDLNYLSSLTIGPAGEKENPFASVISDKFINSGPSMGADFGSKKLKSILLNADSAINIDSPVKDILPDIATHIIKRFGASPKEESSHSCFACVKGCGRYLPKEDCVLIEDDFKMLRFFFPGLSCENLHFYYAECMRQGIDLESSARAVAAEMNDRNVREVIANLGSGRYDATEQCLNTHSWEEAYFFANNWHRDMQFKETDTISSWVHKENIAMVKNCIPLCERFFIPLEDIVVFLNALNGSNYSQNDLLTIGHNLISQTMGVYRDSHYGKPSDQEISSCKKLLPGFLLNDLQTYLKIRKWQDSGYPNSTF